MNSRREKNYDLIYKKDKNLKVADEVLVKQNYVCIN